MPTGPTFMMRTVHVRVDNVDVSCDSEVVFPRNIFQKNCLSIKDAAVAASCDWANSAADDANYLIQATKQRI